MDAAARSYNSALFTGINKSTEEGEAAYRPLLRNVGYTCGRFTRRSQHVLHTPSYPRPSESEGEEVGEGKSQEVQAGCLVARGDDIWERNAELLRLCGA